MRCLTLALGFAFILLLGATDYAQATVADAVVRGQAATGRHTSSPPDRPVTDLAFDAIEEQELVWTMYANGDYDQNGEVNISDVTVIGQNFGLNSSHLDWARARVADGDGNGEVNIADITPIGNSFGSRITHFVLYISNDETGPFEIAGPTQPTAHATTAFNSAPVPPGGGPRPFRHRIAYPYPGRYYTIVAYDGAQAAQVHSNVLMFDPVNHPPIASFSTFPTEQWMTGVSVLLEGSGSSDPDGTIVNFEWDVLGDGSFVSTGVTSALEFQIMQPGAYAPTMRITDNLGATCMTSYDMPQVFVSDGVIHTSVLDSDPGAGIELSCAVIGQTPAIAYIQFDGDSELRYLRSDGADPLGWGAPVLVDTNCSQPSMLSRMDNPLIAYQKDELNFIRGDDADGTSWGASMTIAFDPAPASTRGFQPDIGFAGGNPAIADSTMHTLGPGSLWLTRASSWDGSTWSPAVEVSDVINLGSRPTLTEFDLELAGIVYQRNVTSDTTDVYYRRAQTGNPSGAWHPLVQVTADLALLSLDNSMVAVQPLGSISQVPVIVYWDVTSGKLRSITGQSSDGSGWDPAVDIGTAGNTEGHFSLAMIGGQPVVVFADRVSKELKISWAADRKATTWSVPRVIDSGAEFSSVSLIEHDPLEDQFSYWPAVGYYDADAQNLKFTYITPE
jgi:hypothetical protein